MGGVRNRLDVQFLARLQGAVLLSEVAGHYMKLKRRGREFVGLSPFKSEKTPSFTINDERRFFHDFSSGTHGDVIDLVQHFEGLDFIHAVKFLCDLTGIQMPGEDPGCLTEEDRQALEKQRAEQEAAFRAAEQERLAAQVAQEDKKRKTAREIWQAAIPGAGSLVQTYLESRGIDTEALRAVYGWAVPPSLRFHPNVWHSRRYSGPAMIAVLQDARGNFTGIHRTWIARDGTGKAEISPAKKCLGQMGGASIRLARPDERCFMAEGIENNLFIMGELARQKERVFGLCGVSLGNIAGAGLPYRRGRKGVRQESGRFVSLAFDPDRPGLELPACVRKLTLLCDADGKDFEHDKALMERAAYKFRRTVFDVRLAYPAMGKDFNEMAGAGF